MDFSLILMIALGAMLIFFMFNSRKRQKAQQEKLASELVPGAQVMTSFGLYGEVISVDAENLKVVLESAPGSRVTVHRQAIANIEPPVAGTAPQDEIEDRYASGSYGGSEADYAAEGADADAKPRITDEELDAMNEAKRRDAEAAADTDEQK